MVAAIHYNPAAYQLFHDGVLALAGVEANGIRIDGQYVDKAIEDCTQQITAVDKAIAKNRVYKKWKEAYGPKFKFTSNDQLAHVLFDIFKYNCPYLTDHGNYKTDDKTLSTVKNPFIKKYLKRRKLIKARDTYLKNIKRHLVQEDNYQILRPSFNLHLAVTFRSSADAPSFQNMPIRIPWVSKLIRTAFVAREGCLLIEFDFKGIEVAVAACYHKDPTMIDYLTDKSKDMHRDMAMQIYKLKKEDVGKAIRHAAKNKFVFPEFYGSVWFQVAPALWQAAQSKAEDLTTESGVKLSKHLKDQGFTELGDCGPEADPAEGTFAAHVKDIEKEFWETRFDVYAQWKRDWYNRYKKKGWFKSKTGFVFTGYMKRNEVINYPVQAAAFHCLLKCLIRIQQIVGKLPGVKLVGQIHDSMLFDCPKKYVKKLIKMVKYVTTVWLAKQWRWITLPLEVDVEICPEGGSWFDKKKYEEN